MNVQEYLETEHRQNLLAIEASIGVSTNSTESTSTTSVANGSTVFYLSRSANLIGAVPLDASEYHILSGKVESDVFYPSDAGTYAVEFSCEMDTVAVSPTYKTSELRSLTTGGAIIGTITATAESTGAQMFRTYTGNLMVFADLTPTFGVYFYAAINEVTLRKLSCKITKIK